MVKLLVNQKHPKIFVDRNFVIIVYGCILYILSQVS